MAVQLPYLQKLKPGEKHVFKEPVKRIHVPNDVDTFLCSLAYGDIMTFLQQLNRAMVPAKLESGKAQSWELTSDEITFSEPVKRISNLLAKLNALIDETPPSKEPRRFGNSAFRTWHASLREKFSEWFTEIVSPGLSPEYGKPEDKESAYAELQDYFLGGFGSAQRLDYGTGHELSFLAFLGGLWKLRFFEEAEVGVEERAIVVRIIEPYIRIVRRLIKTYTLEPAGSHGVWGLDDHCFVPYIFGSAQYCPPVKADQLTPVEGSMTNAPEPGDVVKRNLVDKLRDHNMYFSAIGFIYDVKKGPFWEHSPILFDISGIRDGWGKINKGMIKMYNAEVLSKFPVVQHFHFGSLYSWDRDPHAPPILSQWHQDTARNNMTAPVTLPMPPPTSGEYVPPVMGPNGLPMTAAPWAKRAADRPNFQFGNPFAPPPQPQGQGGPQGNLGGQHVSGTAPPLPQIPLPAPEVERKDQPRTGSLQELKERREKRLSAGGGKFEYGKGTSDGGEKDSEN